MPGNMQTTYDTPRNSPVFAMTIRFRRKAFRAATRIPQLSLGGILRRRRHPVLQSQRLCSQAIVPAYPFVIGELDRTSGPLLRRAVQTIDTLQAGEDPRRPPHSRSRRTHHSPLCASPTLGGEARTCTGFESDQSSPARLHRRSPTPPARNSEPPEALAPAAA